MQKLIGAVFCCLLLIPAQTVFGGQQVEVKNLLFQLQDCGLSKQVMTCDFMVTSKGQDRTLTILGSTGSRIIDDMGNEFEAAGIIAGNASDSEWVTNRLVSNIPVKVRLVFQGIPSQAKPLLLLEVVFDDGKAQFRNVPVAAK